MDRLQNIAKSCLIGLAVTASDLQLSGDHSLSEPATWAKQLFSDGFIGWIIEKIEFDKAHGYSWSIDAHNTELRLAI